MNERTILIIDDEPTIAEALAYALQIDGFQIDCHYTGAGGSRVATARPTSDGRLDRLSGYITHDKCSGVSFDITAFYRPKKDEHTSEQHIQKALTS